MKSLYILFLIVALTIFNCGTSKTIASPAEIQKLDNLVNERTFEIESDWAMPMTTNALVSIQNAGFFPPGSSANNVNLLGNPNYFRMRGDSISTALPYYGEVQMTSGYNNNGGIALKGLMQDFKLEKNEKDQSYKITFRADGENENFKVFLTMFPNGRSSLRINGNKRFPIEYTGEFQELDDKITMDK